MCIIFGGDWFKISIEGACCGPKLLFVDFSTRKKTPFDILIFEYSLFILFFG